jgi:nucleoside-diphosphate kinase
LERTLVLIKPDGVQRGLAGEIIARLERRGLRIVAMKLLHMDEALARKHYAEHEGKPFFPGLVEFITSSPLIAAVFEGERAIEAVSQAVGSTDPLKAASGTIRGDYALSIGRNLIHRSDKEETAKREIAIFFDESEIYSYERSIDAWVFE